MTGTGRPDVRHYRPLAPSLSDLLDAPQTARRSWFKCPYTPVAGAAAAMYAGQQPFPQQRCGQDLDIAPDPGRRALDSTKPHTTPAQRQIDARAMFLFLSIASAHPTLAHSAAFSLPMSADVECLPRRTIGSWRPRRN